MDFSFDFEIDTQSDSSFLQLLERNVSLRLGYSAGTRSQIRKHPFFSPIDWAKLENRQIKPPFRPQVVSYDYKSMHIRCEGTLGESFICGGPRPKSR